MASLTRIGYEDIYRAAKRIFQNSRNKKIRGDAKAIAELVERCVGQMDSQPAETWKI